MISYCIFMFNNIFVKKNHKKHIKMLRFVVSLTRNEGIYAL